MTDQSDRIADDEEDGGRGEETRARRAREERGGDEVYSLSLGFGWKLFDHSEEQVQG